jgi:Fic family protein
MHTERSPANFDDVLDGAAKVKYPGAEASAALLREYRPWRKVRYVAPELGLDPEQAWRYVKLSRFTNWKWLNLATADGGRFGVSIGPHLQEPLYRIDRATGGGGPAGIESAHGPLHDAEQRRRYRIRTLMDEAAESSLIEGAATTRKEAVELLRSGREPKKRGERMVLNNYVAMQQVKRMLRTPLSVEMLLELQVTLTADTLDDPESAGRFRRADEDVRVEDSRDNSVIFVPPAAEGLRGRVQRLCEFANRDHEGADFIHPIVKASILHFMIGYEHPFVDGNGRTARAIFYWFALRHGYDIFEYLTISEIIRKGYAQYPQAYLDTECDDGDLTYFVLYKLDVIEQALDRLASHLRKEEEKLQRSEQLLKLSSNLNLRQRLLLEHALRHPTTQYTVKSHMNSNGIAPNTARADLEDLVKRRLMTTTSRGKQVIYLVTSHLSDRLAKND